MKTVGRKKKEDWERKERKLGGLEVGRITTFLYSAQ
jgi:hypothetical protein